MAAITNRFWGVSEERPFRWNRQLILGVLSLLLGLWVFGASLFIGGDTTTRLIINPQDSGLAVPTQAFMLFTGLVFILAGVTAFVTSQSPDYGRYGLYALYLAGLMIIPAILISAAAGNRTNVTTVLAESLNLATPIAIGAMAGLWCERAGVVNVAIEGMMLFAACFGFVALFFLRREYGATSGVLFASVMVAVATGGLVALLLAWLSITFKTNQIVNGTVINILAVGVTSFVRREYLLSTEAGTETLPIIRIPLLSEIPILGEALFTNKPIFYMMFVIIGASYFVLYYTTWGLRTQAVGENPHAADTLGINVNRVRWMNVFIAGMIAGLAGAWFSLETTGRFNDSMTNGRGFISLAALIFGKWDPLGVFGASLLFGFADSLGTRLQILGVPVPNQFLQMVPYVVTIVVLAGLIGAARAPKAAGQPYEKE
jgi:simple sugar transport system permease protein